MPRPSFHNRLREHAASRPQQPAIVTDTLDIGYAELLRRVEGAAHALQREGIGRGAVVGLTIDDECEHLIATLALTALGAGQIVLASHDAPSLRARVAERVGATHRLAHDGTGWVVSREASCDAQAAVPVADGATIYLKTSGTTGDMNIVAFDETAIALQAGRHAEYAGERLLRLASIEHNNSKRHRLYCVWAGGSNVFRPRRLDLAGFVQAKRVTCLDVSRLHAADLAASVAHRDYAHVKIRTGGSAVPHDLRQALLQRVSPQLHVRYAATECGAIAMAGPGDHDADECAGRSLPGVVLEIVDEGGRVLPSGESGEIRLRAPGMATGYLDQPAQTAARFRDGWFHPGDVGRMRADGMLVVQGRRDDMIVFNGLNIFPAEIERVLERHDDVAAAAALALPSRVHGQIPVAVVQARAGAALDVARLQRFGREHLGLRAPRRIVVLDALPRNAQGKMLRTGLAQHFATHAASPAATHDDQS